MSQYVVYKFGGASVKDADGIKNVANIIESNPPHKLMIVVSAMGKTTNALEEVVQKTMEDPHLGAELLRKILGDTKEIISELELKPDNHTEKLEIVVGQVLEFIHQIKEKPSASKYDFIYDQIVSTGELISSLILSAYLVQKRNLDLHWLDAREIIRTNSTHREGRVNWNETSWLFQKTVIPTFDKHRLILTQGFIASDDHHHSVTLGREGSDYTAAICSYCLDAEYMTIWKDVPGVLTADPRLFENVSLIDRLSYQEAIEMTYYGAKVIHPKTIKPLQNKNITLKVKSFIEPQSPGTLIADFNEISYPPVVVVEKNQRLLSISTRDLSFVAEHHLSRLFSLFDKLRIRVNLMRNTAISFTVCITDNPNRINRLLEEIGAEFNIVNERNLELITIRHYQEPIVEEMKNGKIVLFEERIPKTVQLVLKEVPVMKRKHDMA